jgi:gas vesicle protein
MRELFGFAVGVVAGAAGALAATTEPGRRLRERLVAEAEPDVRAALDEWDPLLREVARAVRIGVRELEVTAARAREYIEQLAEEEDSTTPADDVELELRTEGAEPDGSPDVVMTPDSDDRLG